MSHMEPAPAFDLSGCRPAPLPGESSDAFDALHNQLCLELVNPSPLSTILCAQLAEAIIWHQRHQRDKRAIIINKMVDIVVDYPMEDSWRLQFLDVVEGTADDDTRDAVVTLINRKGYTLETLASYATVTAHSHMERIEKLIDRQSKTIRQLQKSIAEVEAKPLIMKRLALQVEQLTRDAQALPHDDSDSGSANQSL